MSVDRILEKAEDVLGDKTKAHEWIDKMSATLGNSPRELAKTIEGEKQVLLHLAKISRHNPLD